MKELLRIAGIWIAAAMIGIVTIAWYRNNGFGIYHEYLKNYVIEDTDFSEKEKRAICVTIDQIKDMYYIEDAKNIRCFRYSGEYGYISPELKAEDGTVVEDFDWRVDIGNVERARGFSGIVDRETLEFLEPIVRCGTVY